MRNRVQETQPAGAAPYLEELQTEYNDLSRSITEFEDQIDRCDLKRERIQKEMDELKKQL